MVFEPVSVGTLVAVAGGVFAYVLRERSKSKNEKTNNGAIKDIKDTMAEVKKTVVSTNEKLVKIDKCMVKLDTNVGNMQKHCGETTARFAKDITENRGDIKGLLKKK